MTAGPPERVVGRGEIRSRLAALVRAAADGRAECLLLLGEAGIGKTVLLEETAGQARGGGLRVVSVTAVASDRGIPGAALAVLVAQLGDVVAELPAQARDVLQGVRHGVVDDTIAWQVLELLATAGARQPVLVCADDVHWWDEASLRALVFVVHRLAEDPVATVLAGRPEVRERGLLAALPAYDVEALAADDAVAMVAAVLPGCDPRVVRAVHAELAGNPLAILEGLRGLDEAVRSGRVPLPDPLPVGRDIAARWAAGIDGVPAATRMALAVLAVDDTRDPDAVNRAWALAGVTGDDLEPAEALGVVRWVDGRWDFRHPVARHAVAATARPAEIRDAHALVARALEPPTGTAAGDRPDPRVTAHLRHLLAAADGPDAALCETASRHAAGLAAVGARASAADLLAAVATVAPDPDTRARVLADAAEQALAELDDERALALAERGLAAVATGPVRGRLRRVHGLAVARTLDPVQGADEVRAALGDLAGAARVHAAADLLFAADPTAGRSSLLDLADEIAGSPYLDDYGRLVLAHLQLHRWSRYDADEVARVWRSFTPRVAESGGTVVEAYFNIGLDLGLDATRAGMRAVGEALAGSGSPAKRVDGLAFLSYLEFYEGRWDRALDRIDETTALCRAIGRLDLYGDAQRAQILARRGDAVAFEEAALAAERTCRAVGNAWWGWALSGERGMLALHDGRPQDAPALFRESLDALDRLGASVCCHTAYADHGVALVETLALLGRRDEALQAGEEVRALVARSSSRLAEGMRARVEAAVAPDDEMEGLLRRAVAETDAGLHVLAGAETRLRLAGWLRRHRRRGEAAEVATSALATFESLGCRPGADRCRAELAAAGVDAPRGGSHDARRDLTPQERQVAGAVAEGLSNREVARQLFLSPRTVEAHLTHAYRKLGVRSRTELVARWRDPTPVGPRAVDHPGAQG